MQCSHCTELKNDNDQLAFYFILEQEWKITSPDKDDQLPQDEAKSMAERELEITSSNEDDQPLQIEADLMATSRDILDD
ncbi:hypothetical protein IWQ61_007870, partial [Dispira simplex]